MNPASASSVYASHVSPVNPPSADRTPVLFMPERPPPVRVVMLFGHPSIRGIRSHGSIEDHPERGDMRTLHNPGPQTYKQEKSR